MGDLDSTDSPVKKYYTELTGDQHFAIERFRGDKEFWNEKEREITEFDKEYFEGSTFPTRDNYKDIRGFILQLRDKKDAISEYIFKQLDSEVKRLLEEYDDKDEPSEKIINGIISEINLIL
ncbi:MAG: hypothetical protein GY861_28035, partial [bacterium]|nr:hypothetical protein [bacterium]